jgi:hypothetical protein
MAFKGVQGVGAKGKSGRKSSWDEDKINYLKSLCVEWAIKQMESNKEAHKKEIVLKVFSKLPDEVNFGGDKISIKIN